jgi:hypothetical protein
MSQGNERLSLPGFSLGDVDANLGVAAFVAVLVPQSLENIECGAQLLARLVLVPVQKLVDLRLETLHLGLLSRLLQAVSRRNGILRHLGHRPAVDAVLAGGFPLAHLF